MQILIADSDRTWARACQWWLRELGHRGAITGTSAVESSAKADLLFVAPSALAALSKPADGTRIVVWWEHKSDLGDRHDLQLVPCRRPYSATALAAVLAYVNGPNHHRLDPVLSGEIMLSADGAQAAAQLVERFGDEMQVLGALLGSTTAPLHAPTRFSALHRVRGAAAAMGASGIVQLADDAAWHGSAPEVARIQAALTAEIAATVQRLKLAANAFYGPTRSA